MVWSIDMDDHVGRCGEKWPMMMSIIHGLGEYVDYIYDVQEAERETLNNKIEKAAREISYYSDKGNYTMADQKEAEMNTLKDQLSAVQDRQQKRWATVQYNAARGGSPIPSIDKPSWW